MSKNARADGRKYRQLLTAKNRVTGIIVIIPPDITPMLLSVRDYGNK
jgi:hypothetical protein